MTKVWATFSHSYGHTLIMSNNGLGYILGEFFTNSSGHSARQNTQAVMRGKRSENVQKVREKEFATFCLSKQNGFRYDLSLT
jgi:hypothetical protein